MAISVLNDSRRGADALPDAGAYLAILSAGIVDSQSVKAPEARGRGYEAHKKINEHKRHIAFDMYGHLLALILPPADG